MIGRHDDDFRRELAERGAVSSAKKPDLVFLSVKDKEQLVELAYLTGTPVWIIYPKGVKMVTEGDVIAAGPAAVGHQSLWLFPDPHRAQVQAEALIASRIASQDPHKVGKFSQVPQSILHARFIFPAQEIQIKKILKRAAMPRAGFYLH